MFLLFFNVINLSKIQSMYSYFTENTLMDSESVIYKKVKKNPIHFTTNISIYRGDTHFEVL